MISFKTWLFVYQSDQAFGIHGRMKFKERIESFRGFSEAYELAIHEFALVAGVAECVY